MNQADEHLLSNPRAERVRRTAALATRPGRRKQGLFLAEGPQPVRETLKLWLRTWQAGAAAHGLPELDALYYDEAALTRHPDIAALLAQVRGVLLDPQAGLPREARVFLREATPEVLAAMGDAESSQGMLAVCRTPTTCADPDELEPTLAGATLVPALLGLQDPGNVGTIIRTADAAGAGVVVLCPGTVDPWSPKVVRSAAGSHFHLPILTGADPDRFVALARRAGLQVLAADGHGELSLPHLGTPQLPTLWLLGHEAHGLSETEKALADHRVAIPLYGQAESLNVATAATVCLYTSAMAQQESPSPQERAVQQASGVQEGSGQQADAVREQGTVRPAGTVQQGSPLR